MYCTVNQACRKRRTRNDGVYCQRHEPPTLSSVSVTCFVSVQMAQRHEYSFCYSLSETSYSCITLVGAADQSHRNKKRNDVLGFARKRRYERGERVAAARRAVVGRANTPASLDLSVDLDGQRGNEFCGWGGERSGQRAKGQAWLGEDAMGWGSSSWEEGSLCFFRAARA